MALRQKAITSSYTRKPHSPFQGEFSTECELVFLTSLLIILSFRLSSFSSCSYLLPRLYVTSNKKNTQILLCFPSPVTESKPYSSSSFYAFYWQFGQHVSCCPVGISQLLTLYCLLYTLKLKLKAIYNEIRTATLLCL
jgi:hypothetical protein